MLHAAVGLFSNPSPHFHIPDSLGDPLFPPITHSRLKRTLEYARAESHNCPLTPLHSLPIVESLFHMLATAVLSHG